MCSGCWLLVGVGDEGFVYLILNYLMPWHYIKTGKFLCIIVINNTKAQGNLYIYWSVHNWLLLHNYFNEL